MKTILLSVIHFIMIYQTSFSQDFQWQSTNGPNGGLIYSMDVDSMGRVYVGGFSGIYRSTNNINDWEFIGLDSVRVFSLHIAANGNIYAGTSEQITYRSTDGGTIWQNANLGIENKTVQSFLDGSGTTIIAGTHRGIFRTIDFGDNWLLVGLTDLSIYSLEKNSLNFMFVGTNEGIYRSVDGGTTWEIFGLDSLQINDLTIDDAGNLFASSQNGLYRSSDNGDSWISINDGLTNPFVYEFSLYHDDELIIGTGGGVFRSVDAGDNWIEANNGLSNTLVRGLASNIAGDLYCSAGGSIKRFIASTDNWEYANLHGVHANSFYFEGNDTIYLGTSGQGIYRSIDNGNTWLDKNVGLESTTIRSIIGHAQYGLIVSSNDGVYYSNDDGDQWNDMKSGMSDNSQVYSLITNTNGDIFAFTNTGHYHFLEDSLKWEIVQSEISFRGAAVNTLDFQFAISNSNRGIFRSTDDGSTWLEVSTDLPDYYFNFSPLNILIDDNDIVYVSLYKNGVIKSEDNGGTWITIEEGLSYKTVYSMAISDDGQAFVGTFGSGVFKYAEIVVGAEEFSTDYIYPSTVVLKSNYPNPFNPITTIEYSLPQSGDVSLIVYNLLGKEVVRLANGKHEAGTHTAIWDASNVASGIYFYSLKTSDFVQTRKMVLLK